VNVHANILFLLHDGAPFAKCDPNNHNLPQSGRLFILREMAFHEKAGRSQVVSSLASLHKVLFSRRVAAVAMLHPHSRERLVSLGACWAFSFQPVLPSVWRP
jgi:hypothetical protein